MFAKQRKRVYLSPPHMHGDELYFVKEALDSNFIAPLGPQVERFEEEFSRKVGVRYALAVTSGTAAMHLVLRALDVGPGDQVIASTLTFIGSVSPITYLGGIPVFIDAERNSWNMDPNLVADEIRRCSQCGRIPKAVIPTDLYGQSADLDRIIEICEPYGIPVVEDAAEALGASYKGRGAGATAGAAVFSFNGNKLITTSGGGMLTSNSETLINYAKFLSNQAMDPCPYYEHSEIGYNYRMSNVLAAIGLAQLRVLDERVTRKREIFGYYQKMLGDVPGIEFMPESSYGISNRWLTVMLIKPEMFGADREQVRIALEAEDIESRPVWKPMHLQPVFEVEGQCFDGMKRGGKRRYKARVIGGEVAEDLFKHGLCLPSGTSVTEEELNRVVEVVLSCQK